MAISRIEEENRSADLLRCEPIDRYLRDQSSSSIYRSRARGDSLAMKDEGAACLDLVFPT